MVSASSSARPRPGAINLTSGVLAPEITEVSSDPVSEDDIVLLGSGHADIVMLDCSEDDGSLMDASGHRTEAGSQGGAGGASWKDKGKGKERETR